MSELVGANGSLREVCRRVELVVSSDISFALLGERGVGKETFARVVACESPFVVGPFVTLSPETLSEERWNALISGASEFSGGLLYIMDAERIPRVVGRRLATSIRSGRIGCRVAFGTTLGYHEFSSNRRIAPELTELWTAFPIAIPPLRERLDDVAEFSERFFRDARERFGVWRDAFSASELARLRRVCWEDNLDGLRRLIENVVERDVFPVDDDELRELASSSASSAVTLPAVESPSERLAASRHDDDVVAEPSRFLTLDEAAKEHIERALRRSHGVVEGKNGAAAALDINPYTLRARMRKLGVDWTRFRDDSDADGPDALDRDV